MLRNRLKYTVFCCSVLVLCFWTFTAFSQSAKPVVLIDPAHGGADAGVTGIDETAEKDITLAIALALQKELANDSSVEVVLTRNSDKVVSLEERRKIISERKPAIVLSLHANAGFGKSASGYEMYYPGFKNIQAGGRDAGGKTGAQQHLNDAVKMARLVQKNFSALFPRKDRGLREADVPLAVGLTVPVLTIEMGFATSPEDRKKLSSAKIQTQIAQALAKSVKSFF
ncbi:MAG: N-acetylmuramoyl-L-alanine amidase [Smithellaceae bacterium]|nr:N-acetylmuramoyl-L-alanine amidase [Smithellaceae bacterium]NLX51992.1 N-acetylmuramoyl-L-alanine amidase [Deltaproteobacteria bacterium]